MYSHPFVMMLRLVILLSGLSIAAVNGWSSLSMATTSISNSVSSPLPPPNSMGSPPFVEERRIPISSGVTMQVLSAKQPDHIIQVTKKPVLLFLHGSFHGAWCWTERWFPYFYEQGYPALIAISWRGTGGTPTGDPSIRKVQIGQHVNDLRAFLEENLDMILPELYKKRKSEGRMDSKDDETLSRSDSHTTTTTSTTSDIDHIQPVIICHSFGGLAVMKYLEEQPDRASRLSGIVTMCSVPPSGNGKLTMRYLQRSWRDSWKITMGFAFKKCISDPQLCRDLFFGGINNNPQNNGGISDIDLCRYQEYFLRDSYATIDLLDLAKKLPSLATDSSTGYAPFVSKLPPCLVIGADNDFLVDLQGYQETATYFGLDDVFMVDSPHDVMLGEKWQNGALAVDNWIRDHVKIELTQ